MPDASEERAGETVAERPARFGTLIFDFDGTIADTLSAIVRLVNEHADEYHIRPLADSDVDELRGMSNLDIIKKYKVPLVKIPSLVLRAQKELNQRIDEMALFPGMKELILGLEEYGAFGWAS